MLTRLLALALLALLSLAPANAASTIDATQPAANSGLTSSVVRSNFSAAANDINNILSSYYGPFPPSNPSIFQHWINTTALPYVDNVWDGAQWLVGPQINTTSHTLTLPLSAFNNGVSATTSTFWRGDGSWAAPVAGANGTTGQIQVNAAGNLSGITLGGDCTFASPLVTCTKLNGVSPGPLYNATVTPIVNGGTGNSTPSGARSQTGLNIDNLCQFGDANFTVPATCRQIQTVAAFTAPRTLTLPSAAASGINGGQGLRFKDAAGAISSTNTLTVTRAGADLINGAATQSLGSAYAGADFDSDGVSKWTYTAGGAGGGGGVSSITAGAGLTGGTITTSGTIAIDFTARDVPVRQTVQSGPIDANGQPTFFPATSASLTLTEQNISTSTPQCMTAMGGGGGGSAPIGPLNLSGCVTANQSFTATASTTSYFYKTITASGGSATVSPGSTTLAPVYQPGGTPSTTAGQITCNYGEMKCYVGNGTTAPQTYLVLIGQATAGTSTISSAVAYAYNGYYESPALTTVPAAFTFTSYNANLGIAGQALLDITATAAVGGYVAGEKIGNIAAFDGTYMHPISVSGGPLVAGFTTGNAGNAFDYWNKTTGALVQVAAGTSTGYSLKIIQRRGWGGS